LLQVGLVDIELLFRGGVTSKCESFENITKNKQ